MMFFKLQMSLYILNKFIIISNPTYCINTFSYFVTMLCAGHLWSNEREFTSQFSHVINIHVGIQACINTSPVKCHLNYKSCVQMWVIC